MLVLRTFINIKVVEDVIAKARLGEHTAYNVLNKTLVTFVAFGNICGAERLLTAGITGEAQIYTIRPFVSCHSYLVSVNDNNVITAICIGCKARFILTS